MTAVSMLQLLLHNQSNKHSHVYCITSCILKIIVSYDYEVEIKDLSVSILSVGGENDSDNIHSDIK